MKVEGGVGVCIVSGPPEGAVVRLGVEEDSRTASCSCSWRSDWI